MVRDEGNGSDRDERVGLFAFVGLVLTEMKRREGGGEGTVALRTRWIPLGRVRIEGKCWERRRECLGGGDRSGKEEPDSEETEIREGREGDRRRK